MKENKGGGVMERLTIDEIIEHCKRTTARFENLNGVKELENADISLNFVKEYWEHKQVKNYLEELKEYKKKPERRDYNKAIDDCIKEVEEEEKQHNHTITKDCLFWLKRKLEQLKDRK